MIYEWLKTHPEIREIYLAKETINKAYRCPGLYQSRVFVVDSGKQLFE
jgi:hypothetical protein